MKGEGEGEVAFFSAKRWGRRNRADLIESATPCHDAQVFIIIIIIINFFIVGLHEKYS